MLLYGNLGSASQNIKFEIIEIAEHQSTKTVKDIDADQSNYAEAYSGFLNRHSEWVLTNQEKI